MLENNRWNFYCAKPVVTCLYMHYMLIITTILQPGIVTCNEERGQPFDRFSSIELITPESLPKPAEVKTIQVKANRKKK